MVMVSLIDRERQWFKACLGVDVRETPRSLSFCSICIERGEILVIEDASKDPLVSDNSLVTGPPYIRFYAGYPLQVRDAYLGTLCIIDTRPRTLSAAEVGMLTAFGQWAQSELSHYQLNELAQELEESQRRYQALFHGSSQAVAVFSVEGEYVEGNALAEALWDIPRHGPPILTPLTFGGRHFSEGFQQALRGVTSFVEPFSYARANGQRVYLQVTLTPLQFRGHCDGVIMAIDDVTTTYLSAERDRGDLESLRAKDVQENAISRREAFVAVLAHEMRNPLNGILGMSEVLSKDCRPQDREMIESIQECAETLSYLIDDTLDLERIEQGRMELEDSVFDLDGLMASVLLLAQPQAGARSITLVNLRSNPLGYVRGDAQRVRQIMSNFVTNAIKYSPEGTEVRAGVTPSSSGFLFEVVDRGVGIAPEALATVFDPFYQAKRNAADSKRGLGLGLNIVKNLVEVMGGTVGVESVLGEGSRFWADLPLPTAAAPLQVEESAREISARILVVDDNPINRRILSLQLGGMGAAVELAEHGQMALDILSQRAFDLLLLDCQMPVLDGFETVRAIRQRPELYGRPVVVALTAAASPESQKECFDAGMDDFLSKPVRNIDLNSKLHSLLHATSPA